jgi:hypothetical protein
MLTAKMCNRPTIIRSPYSLHLSGSRTAGGREVLTNIEAIWRGPGDLESYLEGEERRTATESKARDPEVSVPASSPSQLPNSAFVTRRRRIITLFG